ncbi:hypothetical protein RBXJA2T_01955 [Rubrivivax benzoatilyticus JA2 = ATCC BAA-35]|nr:hypothetical protein RBXJA2T_01955 [Rubrivivax benzoatilyticus JA2 = ATCC BAA-35]
MWWRMFLAMFGLSILFRSPSLFAVAVVFGLLLFFIGCVALILYPPKWGRRR